jgi:NADH-quinone oxidoreductase subunit N
VIVFFSFLIGPFGAITATDLYQFFAYISVTQLAWLLLGLIVYQEKNAVMLYYFYYFLLSSIFVLIITKDTMSTQSNNYLINFINKNREVKIDILLICVFLTLTGLPPTAGFLPKFYILCESF